MARDLHDTTGQELAVLVMSLRHLSESLDRPGLDVRKALADAAELANKVNDEIRTFSYVLHPPLLDQLGLASALKWYVEGFSARSNIEVKLVIPESLNRLAEKDRPFPCGAGRAHQRLAPFRQQESKDRCLHLRRRSRGHRHRRRQGPFLHAGRAIRFRRFTEGRGCRHRRFA